jgi:hypothetical protein
VHRSRHRARGRPRAASSPTRTSASRRAHRAVGGTGSGSADYFMRVVQALAEDLKFSSTPRGGRSPNGPRRPCSSGRTTRSTSSTATGTAASGPTRPVRGRRCRSSSAALRDRLRVEPGPLRGLHA